ncbi:MAG TPA: SpoIIE family protein phosphatase [Frankiaceae bacterium]|nr:SpoIIE family protein phosphatase [Frankiaceae bacterium]
MQRDYRVQTANDGMEALEAIRREPPDLLLTDVMMPRMNGFDLLDTLRADELTAEIPVVMLSARAGEEATVEGLDAGADDYLVKPFSARELLARVRANLELDRVRRTRAALERGQILLDQAQRLARVGSWELDLATGRVTASAELIRQLDLTAEELADVGFEYILDTRVLPDDREKTRRAVASASSGAPMELEMRMRVGDDVRTYRVLGELEEDAAGRPVRLRGSQQDVTDQHVARDALAAASAAREVAEREMRLANELQASLLPQLSFDPDPLQVATYYRAGVEGTQVGGDWYDVIELGAGRTALVIGDVMGRGVKAAAVMGQLRAAARAYARLDLPPADILEYLDGLVRDLGEDQIVPCLYAVYDPGERRLSYANAGHLPALLRVPGEGSRPLASIAEPPLDAGPSLSRGAEVVLPPGSIIALYTDGLVESRSRDIDDGIALLARELDDVEAVTPDVPKRLVARMLPDGPDDDVAMLVALVDGGYSGRSLVIEVSDSERAVQQVRGRITATLGAWQVRPSIVDDVELLASELTTNAILYGRVPVEVRLRHAARHVVLEVYDSGTYLPRRMRPTPDDEHGRGLQLVALLADRWGTRPTEHGKAVWAVVALDSRGEPAPERV